MLERKVAGKFGEDDLQINIKVGFTSTKGSYNNCKI